jgi:hypothetical protein
MSTTFDKINHLYVLSKIESSEERVKAEGTLTQDEVKRRLGKRLVAAEGAR